MDGWQVAGKKKQAKQAQTLPYPSRELFITFDDVAAAIENIKESKLVVREEDVTNYGETKKCRIIGLAKYSTDEIISGRYTGTAQSRARRSDEKCSPATWWQKTPHAITYDPADRKSIEVANDRVWKIVRGCGVMRPKVVTDILRDVVTVYGLSAEGLTVRDLCSGWGDRAIGSCIFGANYYGNDANEELSSGYKALSAEMKKMGLPAPVMTIAPFEDFATRRTKEWLQEYDIMFTSPPFFDREIYEGSSQSYRGQTAEEWTQEFLLPLIDYAFKITKSIVIVNIENTPRKKYVQRMIEYVRETYGIDAAIWGINEGTHKTFRPFFVWKK